MGYRKDGYIRSGGSIDAMEPFIDVQVDGKIADLPWSCAGTWSTTNSSNCEVDRLRRRLQTPRNLNVNIVPPLYHLVTRQNDAVVNQLRRQGQNKTSHPEG